MTKTKVIDRVFPGVGRIARASGTTKAVTFRAINTALDELYSLGRLDILRALKTKKRPTPLEVLDAVRSGNISRLASAELMVTLHAALDLFHTSYPCGEKHRATIKSNVKHVKGAVSKHATVGAVVDAVKALRLTMAATPRAFNLLKSNMQSFAKWHAGERSELYRDLVAIRPYPKKRRRTVHPCSVAEILEIVRRLEPMERTTHRNTPVVLPLGGMVWTLCTTGMRPIEYWGGEWQDRGDYIDILTAKQHDGERLRRKIPRVRPAVAPGCHRLVFAQKLERASDAAVQPYDLRRTFGNWLEMAKIPRTRRRLYMGHGEKDVTDLYEWQEVEQFVKDDGATLRAWLAAEIAKVQGDPTVIPIRRQEGA